MQKYKFLEIYFGVFFFFYPHIIPIGRFVLLQCFVDFIILKCDLDYYSKMWGEKSEGV